MKIKIREDLSMSQCRRVLVETNKYPRVSLGRAIERAQQGLYRKHHSKGLTTKFGTPCKSVLA